jgi:hypothetical protein
MTLLLEDSRYLGVRSQKQGTYDERRNFEVLPADYSRLLVPRGSRALTWVALAPLLAWYLDPGKGCTGHGVEIDDANAMPGSRGTRGASAAAEPGRRPDHVCRDRPL